MQLIHDHLHHWDQGLPRVALKVDRLTLAKRRWRGVADDGAEFGFDLVHPLEDGDVFHAGASVYAIEQKPEPVLEIALGHHADEAARLGWLLGNLHFTMAIDDHAVITVDDPAIRQLLEREQIGYKMSERVFRPLSGGHSHEHQHEH